IDLARKITHSPFPNQLRSVTWPSDPSCRSQPCTRPEPHRREKQQAGGWNSGAVALPECWEDHDQRGKSLKRKPIIKLSHTQEVIKLFDSISQDANLPDTYYEISRYISSPEYDEMNLYELAFEPYLSIAKQCNMNFFALYRSKQRIYLVHCNDAGHPPPRWEAHPIKLSQLKDIELMIFLMRDHAYQLALRNKQGLAYEI
ncbi:hypothetical protein, partial [Aeromonas dhakensis]|uniref:hypothetical protein n=1 Tax=Aeromonas dhakensis TaxID=196024 RepID=UPI00195C6771